MLHLPNNCRAGKFSVTPANWKSVNANRKHQWRITYWFYDDNLDKKRKVVIKAGLNSVETLQEKRLLVKELIDDEMYEIKNKGYNQVMKCYAKSNINDLSPDTPFIQSLHLTLPKLKCVHNTKTDIKSTIKFIEESAKDLHFDSIPIKDIRRRHIKRILDHCADLKQKWSCNTFNAYRKNLGILFSELVELEAMDTNPTRDIKKQKTIRKIKKILTPEECKRVDEFTKNYDRRFWLLIHIFFHSGCRTTEIFRVQAKHVNLESQTVRFTILKGNQPFEVDKPIKNIACGFWKEAIQKCAPNDFVFGKGLNPAIRAINPRQAARRWRRHIKGDKEKGKLGITCDWYALKYLNTDQIAKSNGIEAAGFLNSHTNINTTKLYAVNEDSRMREAVKQMKNSFS